MVDKNDVGFKVLGAISVLTKKLAKSELKIRRTQEFTKEEVQLNRYFDTSSGGTWMLCGIISYYFDNHGEACNFNNLSSCFGCTVMSVIAYKDDIEKLLAPQGAVGQLGAVPVPASGGCVQAVAGAAQLYRLAGNRRVVFFHLRKLLQRKPGFLSISALHSRKKTSVYPPFPWETVYRQKGFLDKTK